jgi:folate-binding protein YgfZ
MAVPPPDSLLPDPHDIVLVDGPDAAAFLQGQISQDVLSIPENGWAWSFVLAPDGKLDALVRVHRVAAERFALIADAGFGDLLQTRLARFKLRTDCTISLEADVAADARAELERIEAGVPVVGVDVQPGDLAASTGLVDAAVDFTKGCFVGQELVARMDSRGGTAPTRLVRLRGRGEAPAVDAPVEVGIEAAGRVTSSTSAQDGWVALASVSRKLDAATASVAGQACTVEALP